MVFEKKNLLTYLLTYNFDVEAGQEIFGILEC